MARAARRQIGRQWIAGALLALVGCTSIFQPQPYTPIDQPATPGKKQLRVGQFLILTDAEINRDHPLLKGLEGLQEQICKELRLPSATNLVYVFLFSDRSKYELFMHAYYRNLPSRRAFFMARTDEKRGDELIVYTYWGDRVQEDLRHELTHATLHGVLKDVPMWLDEGLAEYFETPPEWKGINYRHLAAFRNQPDGSFAPCLKRLEQLTQVKEMSPADYREAWAWVHLMLNYSAETKAVLLQYIQQLRTNKSPGPLEPPLTAVLPNAENTLREHIAKLEAATRTLPATASKLSNANDDRR
jgi:hypothetical protein